MSTKTDAITEYINSLPEDRKKTILKLRETISGHLPIGFSETISYGMIGYVVPHQTYPQGYHCNPTLPLPFIQLASQKNYIAIYHMGLYTMPELLKWFTEEYKKQVKFKLDMGKSCIRFKNASSIPYELIADLSQKVTVSEWIEAYERNLKR